MAVITRNVLPLIHIFRLNQFINLDLGFIKCSLTLFIQGVSKKSRQFRNGSQSRAAASSMKFFVNIDCWDTCNVE